MADNIYQRVTDSIVTALESGVDGWKRPWSVKAGGSSPMPHNVASGAHYRGINTVMLWCATQHEGYSQHVWGTYQQWKEKGAQVRKGEKATPGVFFKPIDRTSTNDNGDEEVRRGAVARGFSLFNVDQVDGYVPPAALVLPEVERIERAETFLRATGAVVREGGTIACYVPSQDVIRMPEIGRFPVAVEYYSTLAHETVHWTAAEKRCDRKIQDSRFGSETYAMEELVAELGAAYVCATLGLDDNPRDDHAQYIASWIKVLKKDHKAIFTAASMAQKATDYLVSLQPAVQDENTKLAAD